MRALLVLALLGATAQASPLGVLWHAKAKCPTSVVKPKVAATKDALVWIEKSKLIRYARATGAAMPAVKLQAKAPVLVANTDDLIVVTGGHELGVLDATSGKRLWRRQAAKKATHGIVAVVEPKGPRIAYALPPDQKHGALAIADARSGVDAWRIETPRDVHVRGIAFGATRLFVLTGESTATGTVTAYAYADGKELWHATPGAMIVAWNLEPSGDDVAVLDDKKLTWLDGAGKVASTLPFANPSFQARTADRIYVTADNANTVVAIDRASRKQVWQIKRAGWPLDSILRADATSVYITDRDQLVELDAKTGKELARLGIAGHRMSVTEAKPGFVACDGAYLTAWDASAIDLPIESATITGKVKCLDCVTGMGDPMWIVIGGVKVETKKGAFSIPLKGRGTYEVKSSSSRSRPCTRPTTRSRISSSS